MRVVLDTNVLISALFWPGPSHRIWESVRDGGLECVTSEPLLAELRDVLGRRAGKFMLSGEELRRVSRHVRKHVRVVVPRAAVHLLADEPDNRVLECAVEARCTHVVTGDRTLLVLREFQGIELATAARFWMLLSTRPRPLRGKRRRR